MIISSNITLPPELFFPSLTKAVFQTMAYIINMFFTHFPRCLRRLRRLPLWQLT